VTTPNPYPGLVLNGMEVAKATAARARYMAELQRVERSFPELKLRVSATPVGMRLVASVYLPADRFQRKVDVISEAVWTPAKVSLRDVVDWAQRALAKWLEDHPEEMLVPPPALEMDRS
jgi:hypothetical protein